MLINALPMGIVAYAKLLSQIFWETNVQIIKYKASKAWQYLKICSQSLNN